MWCFMRNFFVGVLAYADDFVILALTPRTVRLMLAIRDKYANDIPVFRLMLESQSPCLVIRPKPHCSRPILLVLLALIIYFMLVVSRLSLLINGHILDILLLIIFLMRMTLNVDVTVLLVRSIMLYGTLINSTL
jgi:hypothetical protein